MTDDSRSIFNSILADWHRWAQKAKATGWVGSSSMFNQAKSPRGYDSESDIAEWTMHDIQMASVEFHIFELSSDYCTAIQLYARNLVTGKAVWMSARLPIDVDARNALIADAKTELLKKLVAAGVV